MPNRIDSNLRDLLMLEAVRCLDRIRIASGYNTDPFVTDDPRHNFRESGDQFTLYLHGGDEEPQDRNSGPRWTMAFEMWVLGYASAGEDETPQRSLNKLLQDVRTALSNNIEQFATIAGRGVDFDFGSTDTYGDETLGDGWGGFRLEFSVMYKSGPDW